MNNIIIIAIIAILLLFSVKLFLKQPFNLNNKNENIIRSLSFELNQASQQKNINKVISYYADDAVVLGEHTTLAKGNAAIRIVWEKIFSVPDSCLTFKTSLIEVAGAGDLAYEYGTFTFTIKNKNNEEIKNGKYVTIWKKQINGLWKIIVDAGNSDS